VPKSPIYEALTDSLRMLEDLRQLCNAQQLEKLDALRSQLHHVISTTEFPVGLNLPGAPLNPVETVATGRADTLSGEVLKTSDTTLLRTIQEQVKQGTLTPDEAIETECARSKPDTLSHPNEAYIGRDGQHIIRWVPEAVGHNLYAVAANDGSKRNCTGSIHQALQFLTRQECEEWCERHPVPKFIPMEHAFMDFA